MENRINIAELLEDCPRGMELDCILFDAKVIYQGLSKRTPTHPIIVQTEHGFEFELTQYGQIHNIVGSNCVIYPKGKTTWEGFVPPCKFKDGDIVATATGMWIGITTGGEQKNLIPTYCVINSSGEFKAYFDRKGRWAFDRLATEEEKQKLFDAIKANGYKWNAETKTLDKLIEPSFKVGDKVRHKNNHGVVFTITSIEEDSYVCGAKAAFWFDDQDDYELVPNKFDITTLKPFDNCKYSLDGGITWKYAQYWFIQEKYNTNDISIELWQG